MSAESPDNIMMIGPSQAGKTTLLSVLRLASARKLRDTSRVGIRPVNADAKLLFEKALDIAKIGNIVHGATLGANRHVFELSCDVEKRVPVETVESVPGAWPWSRPTEVKKTHYRMETEPKSFTLTVLDGKGGDIFGDRDPMEDLSEYNRRRDELVELAAQSVALVVCVNPSDRKSTELFFTGLQRFLDDVYARGVSTPFARVAIALTQADRQVEQFGSSALVRLEATDPAEVAISTMGAYARAALFQALSPAARKQVYVGWVSVYGFIPNEGSVNFDSSTGRVALYNEGDARWTDDWWPYGVIEPFLFACTGRAKGLKPVSEPTD